MARPPTPPELIRELFNCKLPRETIDRLKIMCFRRSVHAGKKVSEGAVVEELIHACDVPRKPTQEEVDAYIAGRPERERDDLRRIAALPPPKPRS